MKIKSIHIKNLKGFEDSNKISLSPKINVIIGSNNSGKSTIIKSCYFLQKSSDEDTFDYRRYIIKNIRKGTSEVEIKIEVDQLDKKYFSSIGENMSNREFFEQAIYFTFKDNDINRVIKNNKGSKVKVSEIRNIEPHNYIYPFFSNRKATQFNEVFNVSHTKSISENFRELYAKIDRVSNTQHPSNQFYKEACEKALGFNVSTFLSANGHQAGLLVSNLQSIPLDEMGEGTINILGLIVDLCDAEDKLFLIEEMENDIHPKALKSLLELILEKSNSNQFIISTHSNIVVSQLGATVDCKIFETKITFSGRLPLSVVEEVTNEPQYRIKVLKDLGYELHDFELWSAYLVLEESSAEKIIKDYLIPTFVPELTNKLKTIAAQGVGDIEPRFDDLLRLFVFIHLESIYNDKAWIIADGDNPGLDIIKKLKKKFSSWKPEHFSNFSKSDFEEYYPEMFQEKASKILEMDHGREKQKEKGMLVNEVFEWALKNKEEAEEEFKKSAEEIIAILLDLKDKIIN